MSASNDRPNDDEARRPRAIRFDEPAPTKADARTSPRKPAAISTEVVLTAPEDDPFLAAIAEPGIAEPRPRRGLTAGKVFLAALGILVSLAVGVWTDALIRDLFARLPWLGWVALAAAAIAVLALAVYVIRELASLRRLTNVAELRAEIAAAGKAVSAREARKLAGRVSDLLAASPDTARGRAALKALDDEIVDGPQLLAFAERELMANLDRKARSLTLNAARRVSVVTAVSPRALVDVAYVVFESVRLIRAMAALYGGRPGTFGMLRLFRDVVAHLAVTGAVAAGDSLIQQMVGHGLAARLSARLGEGVVNGLMTARIGLSAMDLCRPMPFAALKRPGMGEFLTDIARFADPGADQQKAG
jgi:putative membrane protein